MSGRLSAHAAKRLATAAAFGGGGLGILGAGSYGILRLQAGLARKAIDAVPLGEPLDADGIYGMGPETPIRFAVLGDSAAAGYGVDLPEQTLGAQVAAGLAVVADRPVQLFSHAVVGAQSGDLADQVQEALRDTPAVALIVIGGNDITNRVPPAESVRLLETAVRELRAAGCEVVVGTCPDLGTVEPIPHPLRWLARYWSRRLAAAQTVATVQAGGRTVSLSDVLGPEFSGAPTMFAADRFHPSAAGYETGASAILPPVASALGLVPDPPVDPLRGDSELPISVAAAAAVERSGAEVSPRAVGGTEHGPRGRWAMLRFWPRRTSDDAAAAGSTAGDPADDADQAATEETSV